MSLPRREITVMVAGLTISQVRIAGRVSREADSTQAKGTVDFYNLAPQHSDQIHERGGPVRVDAGYTGHVGTLIDGTVQRVQRGRADLAHITHVRMGDMLRGAGDDDGRLGGFTNRQYEGAVPTRDIALDFIADMGYTAGPLDNIPASAHEIDFGWVAQSDAGLTVLLNRYGLTYYEDDGVVRIGGARTTQPDATSLLLSPDTGLVGAPTPTDEGLEVVSFLNPLIRISSILTVESRTVRGRWKVVSLEHQFDNWDGAFVTRCDTRAL